MTRAVLPRELQSVLASAIRVAADGPLHNQPYGRTLIKRSLIDDLRTSLDHAGFADDWRLLADLFRVEERTPTK